MTKRHNIIVLLVSFIISATLLISSILRKTHSVKNQPVAKVFEGPAGWGYDILVNDTIFIHQEYIPGLAGKKGFDEKQQAEKTSEIVLQKVKSGAGQPTLTTFEIEKILSLKELQHGR